MRNELKNRIFLFYPIKRYAILKTKTGSKTYFQVSDDISRPETFEREIRPLLSVKDAYPKILLARTKHAESQHEGIRILEIAQWLVGE